MKILKATGLVILFFLLFASCKKDKQTNDTTAEENELKKAAEYNNGISPGVGNFLIEEELLQNQQSQVLAKLAYKGDSLFFLGSTDASAKATSVHTIIMSKGSNRYLVTEYLPDNSSSIMYTILNKVKGRLVTKTTIFGNNEKEVSLLDYNWTNNTYKVITSTFYENNVPAAIASKKSRSNSTTMVDGTICGSPTPSGSDQLNSFLDENMKFIACNGTHPINSPIVALNEKLKNMPEFKEMLDEMTLMQDINNAFTSAFDLIKDSINKYKFKNSPAGKSWDWIKEFLKKYTEENKIGIRLSLSPEDSDLEFNEGSDEVLKVTFKITRQDDGTPYTNSSVLVDFGIREAGSAVTQYSKTGYSSKIDGKVTFILKPEEIANLGESISLQGLYDYKSNNFSKHETIDLTFKWLVPNISIVSGNNQPGVANKKLSAPLKVKIVDDNGKPINKWPVSWQVKAGNGFLSSDSETNSSGIAQADFTFGNDLEVQQVEVSAKKKDGSLANGAPLIFNAGVIDSTEIYRAAMVGNWTLFWYGDYAGSVDEYNLVNGGTGQRTFTSSATSPRAPIPNGDAYNTVTWRVYKSNNAYYLSMPYENRNIAFGGRITRYPNIEIKAFPLNGSTTTYTIMTKQ